LSMRRRRGAVRLSAVLVLTLGCAGKPQSDPIVPLDQVPAVVMKAARRELPGYTFETAYKMRVEGKDAYEVRGKNRQGKTREVEVSATGDVLAVE